MNKIEEIEELIAVWKAVEEHGVDYGMGVNKEYAKGKKEGFEAALDIFRRPSNNVVEDRQAKRVGVCKVCGKTGSNYSCKACYKETLAT